LGDFGLEALHRVFGTAIIETAFKATRRLRMGAGKSGESPALSRSGDRGRKPLRAVDLKLAAARNATGAEKALGRRGE
jgi:hypothetical protein